MKKNYLYVRNLKKVDFTVFCVDTDQKSYYDRQFGTTLPFSPGQQVKRCIMETILGELGQPYSPITFNFSVDKDKLKQKEIIQPCDPRYPDQLIGGWMSKPSTKNKKDDDGEANDNTRRSPLSISPLKPIHPLLASLVRENIITFDRTESNSENMVVRDKDGKVMSEEEIKDFIETSNSKLTKRKFVGKTTRANGFFITDVAIDMNRLFRIPVVLNDMETSISTNEELKQNGWLEIEDNFGKWLELPKELHEPYAQAIAEGIIRWKISSNQSRTFDNMPTLSVAISNRADEIDGSIRADLYNDDGKTKAEIIIDDNYPNTKIFSTNVLKGYLSGVETSYTAIDDSISEIKNAILEFYK